MLREKRSEGELSSQTSEYKDPSLTSAQPPRYVPSIRNEINTVKDRNSQKIYRELERYRQFTNALCGDFPGGSMAKTALPVQGAQVHSLVRELDPTCHNQTRSTQIYT